MVNFANDTLVALIKRLSHWHQRRVLRGLAHLGLRLNLPINGLRLRLDPVHDYLQWQMLSTGAWERPVERIVERIARDSQIVFDVGANIGYFSLLSASLMRPDSVVVAFEPFPRNFALLQQNAESNRLGARIRAEGVAVAGASGEVMIYHEDDFNWGTPSMVGHLAGGRPGIRVPAIALDDYRRQHFPGRSIDLVKIDVEGGERDVLLGMDEGISKCIYKTIIIEIHPENLSAAGTSNVEVVDLLKSRGYRVRAIERDGPRDNYVLSDEVQKFLCEAN